VPKAECMHACSYQQKSCLIVGFISSNSPYLFVEAPYKLYEVHNMFQTFHRSRSLEAGTINRNICIPWHYFISLYLFRPCNRLIQKLIHVWLERWFPPMKVERKSPPPTLVKTQVGTPFIRPDVCINKEATLKTLFPISLSKVRVVRFSCSTAPSSTST